MSSRRRGRGSSPALSGAAVLIVVIAALVVSAPARAADAPDDRVAQARALLQEANAQYAVGEFLQAAEKYQAAYKLKPDPALLYNAAQSYRMAGNNEKALLLYKNYVMFYPSAKNVPNVEQQIAKLQEAIAAQEKAKTQPPTTTEPTSGVGQGVAAGGPTGTAASAESASTSTTPPPATSGVPAAPPPAAAPSSALTASPSPSAGGTSASDEPIYKKWWLWTAVGVVVVGGVVTALALSSSSKAWATAPDFGPGASHLVGR